MLKSSINPMALPKIRSTSASLRCSGVRADPSVISSDIRSVLPYGPLGHIIDTHRLTPRRSSSSRPSQFRSTCLPRNRVNTSRGRQEILHQRLDAVAGSDPTARKYVGSQPASVDEATQHSRLRQPFEVRTRLAPSLTVALDLPHPEASSDQLVERDAPHYNVSPRFDRRQLDAF